MRRISKEMFLTIAALAIGVLAGVIVLVILFSHNWRGMFYWLGL